MLVMKTYRRVHVFFCSKNVARAKIFIPLDSSGSSVLDSYFSFIRTLFIEDFMDVKVRHFEFFTLKLRFSKLQFSPNFTYVKTYYVKQQKLITLSKSNKLS